jgi:hypothetical protein
MKVYLLTRQDDIEVALIGPDTFDWPSAERAFEKAHDLYYPRWEPLPAGTPREVFQKHWEQWRDSYVQFRKERSDTWDRYYFLFADWLVQNHDFKQMEFELR